MRDVAPHEQFHQIAGGIGAIHAPGFSHQGMQAHCSNTAAAAIAAAAGINPLNHHHIPFNSPSTMMHEVSSGMPYNYAYPPSIAAQRHYGGTVNPAVAAAAAADLFSSWQHQHTYPGVTRDPGSALSLGIYN